MLVKVKESKDRGSSFRSNLNLSEIVVIAGSELLLCNDALSPLVDLVAELVDGGREHIVRLDASELHGLPVVLIGNLLEVKADNLGFFAQSNG